MVAGPQALADEQVPRVQVRDPNLNPSQSRPRYHKISRPLFAHCDLDNSTPRHSVGVRLRATLVVSGCQTVLRSKDTFLTSNLRILC
jgi:hypothetical protein